MGKFVYIGPLSITPEGFTRALLELSFKLSEWNDDGTNDYKKVSCLGRLYKIYNCDNVEVAIAAFEFNEVMLICAEDKNRKANHLKAFIEIADHFQIEGRDRLRRDD